jgi:hypothetical protein
MSNPALPLLNTMSWGGQPRQLSFFTLLAAAALRGNLAGGLYRVLFIVAGVKGSQSNEMVIPLLWLNTFSCWWFSVDPTGSSNS